MKTILDYDGLGHALSSAGTVSHVGHFIMCAPGNYILYVSYFETGSHSFSTGIFLMTGPVTGKARIYRISSVPWKLCCGSVTFCYGYGSVFRNRGSVLLTYGYGSGSCSFHQWLSRREQNTSFFSKFFAYYFLKVHLHQSSKIKSHKEVTKQ